MKNVHIISIGNELLIGDTVNTNASWIGRFLTERGFRVDEVRTISDSYAGIQQALKYALEHASLVICTGGIGPTHDDITKKAVAELFSSEMILNRKVLAHIKEIFNRRELRFTRSNRDQAMVPDSCEVLFNKKGTAPGMWFQEFGSCLVVLPGVPFEMKYLMENKVGEKIERYFTNQEYRATRYLKTAGVPESTLSDEVIGDLSEHLRNGYEVAYLPSPSGVTLRVSSNSKSLQDAEEKLELLLDYIRQKAGPLIFGEGRDLMLSETVGNILAERGLTIGAAESCTGGLIANSITDIPGSSRYFPGSIVAYENRVKTDFLGVSAEDLHGYGAVSKKVALQMAKGICKCLKTDIGVSATGIAGPGGGTRQKPVGTVWMGFYINNKHFALKARFSKDRLINKERTVMLILETVRRELLQMDSTPYDLKPYSA